MRKLAAMLLATCAAALAAGCGSSEESKPEAVKIPSEKPAAATTPAAPAAPASKPRGETVSTHGSQFGRILSDGRGRALYVFTREKTSRSECYGECADAWPPLLTKGKPRAAGGADASLLGTTRRRDGSTQVTYKGQPVYYYVSDTKPGQVTCQAVAEFGGTWLVADKDGNAIR